MKIKKILMISIITIIAILGISTQVKAKNYSSYGQNTTYHVGDTVTITTRNKNVEDRNLLCLEHNQNMTATTTYTVSSVVKIRGRVSTDHKNKSIDSWYNAKMAYIAADKTQYSNVHVNNKQTAMWGFAREWLNQVGKHHAGLWVNFAQYTGDTSPLLGEAEQYANSIKSDDVLKIKDNTNKELVQKNVTTVKVDNKSYIKLGPINLSFPGKLKELKVYDTNNNLVTGKKFAVVEGKKLVIKKRAQLKSNQDFYILLPEDINLVGITKIGVASDYELKTAELTFFYTTKSNWQNLVRAKGDTETVSENADLPYNIIFTGNLRIIKVDKNYHEIKLDNVEFIVKRENDGKYVKVDGSGNVSLVDLNQGQTVFKTDSKGEIFIENLPLGNYTAIETKNPHYGYELVPGNYTKAIVVNDTVDIVVENEQKWVKLAGYVWEDVGYYDLTNSKTMMWNNLYKDANVDSEDKLMDGITVRLKDKQGNIVKNAQGAECITTTKNGGAYEFVDIEIAQLENYYVEFEYDGLTYTNVVAHLDKDNGSKAIENTKVREQFNNNFFSIEGTGDTTGISKNDKGEKTYDLRYNKGEGNEAIFINDGSYIITANTGETGFNIKDKFKPGMERIENINLGLYEREQPDLALSQDINNVKITINGFAHVYKYDNWKDHLREYRKGEDLNVAVLFEEKDTRFASGYSRPIYESDLNFTTEDGKNELEVYVTYGIDIENWSTSLKAKANSIVDYYSKEYGKPFAIGTSIDEEYANVKNDDATFTLDYSDDTATEYNEAYNKVQIKLNNYIDAQKIKTIYVQFKLDRKTVLDIINGSKELKNIAEITSYSVQDKDGKTYAGIDVDSNPGNAKPDNKETYEDDTDYGLSLKLNVVDSRVMQGIVFLDATKNELQTAYEREANGMYVTADGDAPIGGVKVTLKPNEGENPAAIKTVTTTTATEDGKYRVYLDKESNEWKCENVANSQKDPEKDYEVEEVELKKGEFFIPGYIPGNYTLTYTWGAEKGGYNVEDFKGTIYIQERKDMTATENNATYKPEETDVWYKKDGDTRYSDAIDDWQMRMGIDKDNPDKTEIDSSTPKMKIGVEYDTTYTVKPEDGIYYGGSGIGDNFTYQIKNIDFGIVERARQILTLDKSVKTIKITLSNGQTIVDAKINDAGKLEGQIEGVTSEPPIGDNLGFVKAELDSELMQGSVLDIGYDITVKNISENDYVSEYYYKYGLEQAKKANKLGEILRLNVTELKDNLDSTLVLSETENNKIWEVKESDNDKKTVFNTNGLATEKGLAPNDSNNVILQASKILSSKDINTFNNDAKITKVARTEITTGSISGPYGRKSNLPEDAAEQVIVDKPTGENLNYILPIVIGISTLIILSLGIVIIKKKVIKE